MSSDTLLEVYPFYFFFLGGCIAVSSISKAKIFIQNLVNNSALDDLVPNFQHRLTRFDSYIMFYIKITDNDYFYV